ncbi:MAG: NrfD/PsrC family molybdoenzyme membrane anchor subunit [Gordonibacter sp.]|nr:NrfD/PsrC family molybdoenzyme membrane anchor subunit [Gordonibacter sp.]
MTETTSRPKAGVTPLIVLGLLAVLGIACWIAQVTSGAHLLNLNNHVTWGLYLVGFVLCTGIAAGCLAFASATVLFGALAALRPYARLASFVSVTVGCVGAGLFIMADLGSPARFWEMIAFAHAGSPLFWDTIVLLVYVVVSIVLTVQLVRAKQSGQESASLKPLAVVGLIAGVCVAITSFVFAFQVARPLWNNPGQTLSFILAAVVAAGSVLVIVFALANRSSYLSISDKLLGIIGKTVALFLLVELVFALTEVAGGLFAGTGEESTAIAWLTTGPGAPFFWVEIVACVAGAVLLMQKETSPLMGGALAALLAIFLVKYNLLQAELFNPLINFAGYDNSSGIVGGFYAPSLVEWGVTLGIIALCSLALIMGMRKFNLGK